MGNTEIYLQHLLSKILVNIIIQYVLTVFVISTYLQKFSELSVELLVMDPLTGLLYDVL